MYIIMSILIKEWNIGREEKTKLNSQTVTKTLKHYVYIEKKNAFWINRDVFNNLSDKRQKYPSIMLKY